MRVSIHTYGTRGDVQPYVALSLGLKAAGHEPVIAGPEQFAGFVEGHGIAFQPLPGEMLALIDDPAAQAVLEGSSGFAGGLKLIGRMRPAMNRMLVAEWQAALAARPDILVHHPKSLSSPSIAERLGIPLVLASPLPGFTPTAAFPSPILPFRSLGPLNRWSHGLAIDGATRLYAKQLGHWRENTLALPPKPPAYRVDATLYAYSPSVLPKPRDWGADVHVTGYWFLDGDAAYEPDEDLRTFLASGPAPVYVGFGSMPSTTASERTRTVVAALQEAGVRGLLAVGGGAMMRTEVPEGIFVIEGAPHDWLFPRMSAVVHHGGAGSTAAGLRAGRPTVICPFFGDQPFWGSVVQGLGVGPPPISRKAFTVERLTDAIRTVTTKEAMQQSASKLGASIRSENGVAAAIAVLEAVAARRM